MRPRALRSLTALVALLIATGLGTGPARAAGGEPPPLSATSAILIEASSGEVVFQRAADKHRPIASTTKLMTALLTVENTKLTDKVAASDYIAAPIESKLSLRAASVVGGRPAARAEIESANDAAVTLAEERRSRRAFFAR